MFIYFKVAFLIGSGWVFAQLVRDILVSAINATALSIMHRKQAKAYEQFAGSAKQSIFSEGN